MVVTFVIAVSLYMALTTSRVFVFLFESGLEKAKYIFLFSENLGSSAIPESPPWPAKRTSGTPPRGISRRVAFLSSLNFPVHSVTRRSSLSKTAIPQG